MSSILNQLENAGIYSGGALGNDADGFAEEAFGNLRGIATI